MYKFINTIFQQSIIAPELVCLSVVCRWNNFQIVGVCVFSRNLISVHHLH